MNWVSYLDFEKLEKGTEISKIMEFKIDVDSRKYVCGKNQHYSCVTDLFSFFCVDCLFQLQQEAVAAQQKEYEKVPDAGTFRGLFACGIGGRKGRRYDFKAKVNMFLVEKKDSNAETEEMVHIQGDFNGTFAPSALNIVGKTVRTVLGTDYFHKIFDSSIFSRMLKRVQPLTTDEIDCLIEYSKDQMIERHFADLSRESTDNEDEERAAIPEPVANNDETKSM
eukprot:GEMP01070358.1.p1 GENE.GEMP01070358.1~~GEMP01070358.1.p1  ORF type:complete len:223 (+),score=25.18 GEMP01070358.1:365-1033(+)